MTCFIPPKESWHFNGLRGRQDYSSYKSLWTEHTVSGKPTVVEYEVETDPAWRPPSRVCARESGGAMRLLRFFHGALGSPDAMMPPGQLRALWIPQWAVVTSTAIIPVMAMIRWRRRRIRPMAPALNADMTFALLLTDAPNADLKSLVSSAKHNDEGNCKCGGDRPAGN